MWQKLLASVFAAALFVAAVCLLRWVSTPTQAGPEPTTTRSASKPAGSQPMPITVSVPLQHVAVASGSDQTNDDEQPDEPATRGPAAGVWKVLGKPHAGVAEEREELVAAFRGATPCTERWCGAGRKTLEAWVGSIAKTVPGAVTAGPVECTSAGCWARVALNDPQKWREVSAALPGVTGQNAWRGPSILGGPDFQTQRGTVISLWALLPTVDNETSTPAKETEQ